MEPIKVKKFLHQMLSGIADCHMKRIIHRDLKPANILIDRAGRHLFIQTIWKLEILVLQELIHCLLDHTHNKLSLYGTELLKFFWDHMNTPLLLIFGLLDAFSLKWSQKKSFSKETVILISFTEFSEFLALLMSLFGLESQNWENTKPHSQIGVQIQLKKLLVAWIWIHLAWIFSKYRILYLANACLWSNSPYNCKGSIKSSLFQGFKLINQMHSFLFFKIIF